MPCLYVSFIVLLFSFQMSVNSKICKTTHIRNYPKNLKILENCRIIEGNLSIVLIENVEDESDFDAYSFPNLYEIRGFLMLFRVWKLTSLGSIFPNLTRIGGNKLFLNTYSLILYDLPNLEEIGLKNLRHIDRGAVIIDKCPNVCFVQTINWKKIGATNLNFTNRNTEICKDKICRSECRGCCWNTLYCQESMPEDKCHPQCIGCTKHNSSSDCLSCKLFEINGTCIQTCPENTLPHQDSMRCITKKECSAILNSTCVQNCPTYYKKIANTCVYVRYKGKVDCSGPFIIKVFKDLDNLRYCTHINGSLELNINAWPSTLRHFLGSIVSISGYLKIARSHEITSLDFLNNLKEIKGQQLYNSKYALLISQNRNLQLLWNSKYSLMIRNGTVAIENNPKLCKNEIIKFLDTIKNRQEHILQSFPYFEFNGYESICNAKKLLKITMLDPDPSHVTLVWDSPPVIKGEIVIGYTVYYIRAANYEHTSYESRDICWDIEKDTWDGVFVRNNSVHLKQLMPNTRYFYYIQIYTTISKNHQTPVEFFRTTGDVETFL